ncbi:MAG: serine hydrolase domain-containing protein [Bacteroidota bacterium]
MRKMISVFLFCGMMVCLVFGLPTVVPNEETGHSKPVAPNHLSILHENPSGTAQQLKRVWLDSMFCKLAAANRINGCVLYAEGEHVVYKRSFGYADFSRKDSLLPSTAFQLASVSKVITSTAVLMLVDKGLIDIHKDIKTYLPDVPYQNITVENLLEHRSGLPNYVYVAENYWDKTKAFSNKDIIPLFKNQGLQPSVSPGKRYQYSNTNYALLALIVEKVSKIPYAEYLQKNIFGPLEMKNSFALNVNDSAQWTKAARGYMPMGRSYKLQEWDYLDGVVGDKDIFSSVEDLFLFANALDKGLLLKPATYQLACTPVIDKAHPKSSNYGLGWRIREIASHNVVYHNGWWRGYKSFFIRLPDKKTTLIVLCNRTNVHLNGLLYDMLLYPEKEKSKHSPENQEEEDNEQMTSEL